MGGRGSSSQSYRAVANSGTGMKLPKPKGFTIDTSASFQRIDTGMSPQDAMDMAAEQISGLDHEMSVLIAQDGTMFINNGSSNKVTVPAREAKAAGYDPKDMYDLHNHPKSGRSGIGGPASGADYLSTVLYGQSESYITAVEGRYTLRVSNNTPTTANPIVKFFYDKTPTGRSRESNYTKNTRKAYYDGVTKGLYSSNHGYYQACYDTLKKFGKKYGFDIEFTPNPGYEHTYN